MTFDFDLFVIGGGSGGVRWRGLRREKPVQKWVWPNRAVMAELALFAAACPRN